MRRIWCNCTLVRLLFRAGYFVIRLLCRNTDHVGSIEGVLLPDGYTWMPHLIKSVNIC